MAQNPFDQLSKQYLEDFLAPIGTVQRQYEIPGEAKFVDVWFVPNSEVSQAEDLGLLGQIVQTPCLLEPYRNSPTRTEVRVSVMKLIWIQEDERRKTQLDNLAEATLPRLWILAATTSKPLLEETGGAIKANWMPGIYFLPDLFKTGIVAIDQLPETEETLWLRILGRDSTQQRAIREVLALPSTHPRRNSILRLLANWKVRIDVNQAENFSGQEALMAFSEAFLEWEQRTEAQGAERAERSLILRLLTRKIGEVPEAARSRIQALAIADLETLGEALLDFSDLTDLENWLAAHS
ncbi:DUF4351 domain-containing protein [Phormidesmis priestleyi]